MLISCSTLHLKTSEAALFPGGDAHIEILLEEDPIADTGPWSGWIHDRDIEFAEQLQNSESASTIGASDFFDTTLGVFTSTKILFMLIAEIAFPRHLVLPYPKTSSCTCRISCSRS